MAKESEQSADPSTGNPLPIPPSLAEVTGSSGDGALSGRDVAPIPPLDSRPWYAEVTRYQWLVLALASAGWVFDTFSGQVYVITRVDMLNEMLGKSATSGDVARWGEWLLAVFLLGGVVGGIACGSLADRFGRKPILSATILCYSIFMGLTYFATNIWQIVALRFLVALGVGGEWAVAAALVAEVFPPRARARASGIFHATSVLGNWAAGLAGLVVLTNWRLAYLMGLAPALLVLWVWKQVKEPDRWQKAEHSTQARGRFRDLLGHARWARPAWLGLGLAAVGLGTFWGVTMAGKDLTQNLLIREYSAANRAAIADGKIIKEPLLKNGVTKTQADDADYWSTMALGIVEMAGGGLGLLCMGPLTEYLGRRRAFALMLVASLLIVPLTCYAPQTYGEMLCIIPFFGFFTLGMHAGFAIYFPELFPNHLRATGTGFCFNGGRLVAAPILFLSGELKQSMSLQLAICILASLFLVGLVLLLFMPETKGQPLPE